MLSARAVGPEVGCYRHNHALKFTLEGAFVDKRGVEFLLVHTIRRFEKVKKSDYCMNQDISRAVGSMHRQDSGRGKRGHKNTVCGVCRARLSGGGTPSHFRSFQGVVI